MTSSVTATPDNDDPLIRLNRVSKSYETRGADGRVTLTALSEINLDIYRGDFVAIQGPSGGGKSTLLNILGLLDTPSSGEYHLDCEEIGTHSTSKLAELRSERFGFVFQAFHLLDKRPVSDSVELGLMYHGIPRAERAQAARTALAQVGLAEHADSQSALLSGGQRQRVAVARAICSDSEIILADEPTGNLDPENGKLVIDELRHLNEQGATVIVVTHSAEVAAAATRRLVIINGRLLETGTDGEYRRRPKSMVALETSASAGQPARIRWLDGVRDAVTSVRSRMRNSVTLIGAVAVAVGLAVTTLGLSQSASAQVASTFDAHLNRWVTVEWSMNSAAETTVATGTGSTATTHAPEQLSTALAELSGVESAAVLTNYGPQNIYASPVRPGISNQIRSFSGDLIAAAELGIEWASTTKTGQALQNDEVLLGNSLAQQLELAPLAARPTVEIGGQSFRVVGLITESPRIPLLASEAILSAEAADSLAQQGTRAAIIRTQAGAAQQVARQSPLVIDPFQPEQLRVSAPTDPSTLRAEIEQGVQVILIALSLIAILGSIAALTNATLLSVSERRAELGLRRAVGARGKHIFTLISMESTILGAAGGILGLIVSITIILAVTLSQRWAPVFDLRLAPLAFAAGLIIGALSGLLAASRAVRMQPADTLRL